MVRSTHRAAGVVALCAGAAAAAQPITAHWLNPVSGSWAVGSNWSTAPYFPSNGQNFGSLFNAVIDAAGAPYTVTMGANGPNPIALQSLHLNSTDATLRVNRLDLAQESFVSAGRFRLGGELLGQGDLGIAGVLQWDSGEMTGDGVTTIEAGGVAHLLSVSTKSLERAFVNDGALIWSDGRLSIRSQGSLSNYGTMTIGVTSGLEGAGAFLNYGVLNINNSLLIEVEQFSSAGHIHIGGNSVRFASGISLQGSMHLNSNVVLRIDSSSTYSAGSSLDGAGRIEIMGGEHVFQSGVLKTSGELWVRGGDVTFHEATSGPLLLNGGTVRYEYTPDFGDSLNTGSSLVFNNGFELAADADVSIAMLAHVDLAQGDRSFRSLSLNGHLAMTGDAGILDELEWLGGSFSGPGVTTLAPGAALSLGGGAKALSRGLFHAGDIAWTGGDLVLDGVSFTNNAQMSATGVGSVVDAAGGQIFTNNGDIDIGGDFGVLAAFSNNGQVHVQEQATFRLGGPVTMGAGAAITGPGAVDFVGGSHTLNDDLLATTGAVRVSGGTVEIDPAFNPASWTFAGGAAQFTGDVSLSGAALSGGALGSTGRLDLDGLTWSGGSLVGGGESAIADGAMMALSGDGSRTLSRSLVNDGAISVEGGSLFVSNGAIDNRGDIVLGPGAGIRSAAGGGSLNNSGLITASGAGTIAIEGSGLQLVNTGTMHFGPGVTFRLGADVAPGDLGSLTVDGDLHFTGGSIAMSAAGWSVSGGISMLGGDVVFAGAPQPTSWTFTAGGATFEQEFNAGALLRTNGTALRFEQGVVFGASATAHVQNGGSIDFASNDAQVGRVQLLGGAIDGEGDLNVAQQLTWSSGVMRGGGRTVVEAGAIGSLGLIAPITLSRTLENFGTSSLITNSLRIDGGELANHGLLRLISGSGVQGVGAGGSIINEGVIRMDGSGPFALRDNGAAIEFRNFGQFEVLEGGMVTLAGSHALENEGRYLIERSSILSVEGDFTNASSATLAYTVGGAKDRGLTGLMTITGDAALSGALAVSTPESFVGAWGDRWTVLQFASLSSDFDTFELPESTDEMLRWYAQTDGASYDVGVSHIADIDHDGLIGFADLNVIASNFNAFGSWSDGDVDGDGFVGFSDLNLVVSLFSTSAPRNVPGPGAGILFVMVGARVFCRRASSSAHSRLN